VIQQLKLVTSHTSSYKEYRAALRRAELPAIPYIGIWLTDLTFIEDGNPTYEVPERINFSKYRRIAAVRPPRVS